MACPDFQSLTLPILQVAGTGGEFALAALRNATATRLGLSEADLAETIPSGRQTRYGNRANWACRYMTEAGLLENVRRGVYKMTERGRSVLADPPERIDVGFLTRFPEFRAWRGQSDPGDQEAAVPLAFSSAETATPEEQMETGYDALRRSVEGDLIIRILAGTPSFFEALVVELLVKMGYGGSLADAGSAIGQSGDDGLDGIIKEDRLGLDAIYVQAKRWRPDLKVGRPDVQAFAGSLEGVRARKGVFLTTAAFSSDAHEYVARIEKKIVLIDGPRLAALMFDFGVGVRTKETYEVKEIDEEFFLDNG